MSRITPGQDAGNISLNLINGTQWQLARQNHDWTIIVAYRGLHCPVCKSQLQDLKTVLQDFADAGIGVVSASMDTEERASKSHEDWELGSVPVAYGLEKDFAEKFGLYVSDAISDKEPDVFSEPAILLFKGTTFYAGWIQTIPFARPHFEDVLKGVKFIQKEDYPPRGKLG
ncbi:MAG: redoxin domain-containing protein [Henriciella sp.]|uniref:redoxin domain-containing protein n=1 Tax=Henriciella sp. TaxID=1968823 RepID=UPI003C75DA6F